MHKPLHAHFFRWISVIKSQMNPVVSSGYAFNQQSLCYFFVIAFFFHRKLVDPQGLEP